MFDCLWHLIRTWLIEQQNTIDVLNEIKTFHQQHLVWMNYFYTFFGKHNQHFQALRIAEQIDAGTVFINTYNKTDVAAPFGGFKQSGFGKDLGESVVSQSILLVDQIQNNLISFIVISSFIFISLVHGVVNDTLLT